MDKYLPVLLAALLFLARIREFLIKRDTIRGPIKEKKSFAFLFLSGTVIVVCAIAEYVVTGNTPSYLFMALGALTVLGAFALRNWGIRTLGKFWSVHVEIRDNHQLIDSGPFKRIRHPVYTGALLEGIGAVLIFQAYYTAILIPLLLIPAILFRIHIEEKDLLSKFGDDYRDYMKRTGSLLPRFKPIRKCSTNDAP